MTQSTVGFLKQCLQPATDLLFPPACAFCGAGLLSLNDDESVLLCDGCQNGFDHNDREACIRCGLPIGPYVDSADGCIRCRQRRFRFRRVVRLGVYEDSLRDACIRGKSPGSEALAAALGGLLVERRREALEQLDCDLVVPVPQHWCHRITRSNHQANTIAEAVARRLQLPLHEHLLRKKRLTRDQSSLQRVERQKNLTRAFQVRGGQTLKDKRILLVDDILTTGTTANEAARAFAECHASSVAVAVLAVVR